MKNIAHRTAVLFTLFLSLTAISIPFSPQALAVKISPVEESTDVNSDAVVVVKFDRGLVKNSDFVNSLGKTVGETLINSGTDAAANFIEQLSRNPNQRALLEELAQGNQDVKITVKAHPNEASAINWMNKRLRGMGLARAQVELIGNEDAKDPHVLNEDEVQKLKWLRFGAGPGVAGLSMIYKAVSIINSGQSHSPKDYAILLLPTAAVGVVTFLLEYQFAHPKINQVFWSKVWKMGGPIGGRATNLLVNIMYGLTIYATTELAANVPRLWNMRRVMTEQPVVSNLIANALHQVFPLLQLGNHPYVSAFVAASLGGALFSAVMGQLQTDNSIEAERGSISPLKRYGQETWGSIVNNSARVGSWIVPGSWADYVMYGFFFTKTLPLMLKTHIAYRLQDREIHRRLAPETAPKRNIIESCALALRALGGINLPDLRR